MELRTYTFVIKRYDPEKGSEWTDRFTLEMDTTSRVLDGLLRVKDEMDGTLTFRRSCVHGICGSCAMRINGRNRLACQSLLKDFRTPEIRVEPLAAFRVIRDLVVDMDAFFEKNEAVMPYLINDEPAPERERLQTSREHKDILESVTCIMCSCCTSSCPGFWSDGRYLGPSALLKAYRFIFDSRDRATEQRLQKASEGHGLWRCRSIYNCVDACPKGIDITWHISRLRRLTLRRGLGM